MNILLSILALFVMFVVAPYLYNKYLERKDQEMMEDALECHLAEMLNKAKLEKACETLKPCNLEVKKKVKKVAKKKVK